MPIFGLLQAIFIILHVAMGSGQYDPFFYHSFTYIILTPVDSARNLGVTFDTNLSTAQHISAVLNLAFTIIRDLICIRCTSHIHSTLKCIIVTVVYLICAQLKSIVFNLSSTLILMLSPIS